MKRIFLFLLLLALMISAVSADDKPKIIGNKGTPIDDKPLKVKVTYVPYQESVITTILKIIGLEPKETKEEKTESKIDVYISDQKVATIPEKSKFADMEIHDVCLPYQYGTNNWYKCERSLL